MRYFSVLIILLFLSNAKAQNVGIGTLNPIAKLHVADSAVVFSNDGIALFPAANPPIQGAGIRLMWYPQKAAFRAGAIDDGILTGQIPGFYNTNSWDRDNIGSFSFAAGYNTKASGLSATALGFLSTAMGEVATAIGFNNNANGQYALAMGYGSIADGYAATAIGNITNASGYAATAFGNMTNASGYNATAFGNASLASGDYSLAIGLSPFASGYASTAIGSYIQAKSYGGFVIGSYNDILDNPNQLNPIAADRIFQIGIGISSARKNAITVLRNGNTGIGIAQPTARLQVTDSSVLFNATGFALSNPGNPPQQGVGRRMMWYADKAAFRTGAVVNNLWDKDSIGNYSFAAGFNVMAKGEYAASLGYDNKSLGFASLSIGYNNVSDYSYGTAIGYNNRAMNLSSVAIGRDLITKSSGAITLGAYNDTTDSFLGFGLTGTNDRIFQIGNGNSSTRSNAITILQNGNTGINVLQPAYILDVGARIRVRSTPGLSAGVWFNNDNNSARVAFVGMRSNTEVGFYGETGVFNWRFYVNTNDGNAWLQGSLQQNSDATLKKNIRPLSPTLNNLQLLNGYTYNWKDNSNSDQQIGLLAQEIQKVYPQLVKENQGKLSVNYSGMVPVLLEAIKEQQQQIERLQKEQEETKKIIKLLQMKIK